tara:strand:- start:462 stop:1091 length:630 start_codon:yes stop_codon:yes gene_type:complete
MARGNLTCIAEMPRAQEGENPPSLIFDAVVNTAPSSTARLSKYPISDRTEITNHRVKQNPTLQLTAWMGRSPLQNYENNLVGVENEQSRPQLAYDILKRWDEESVELYIASEYDNFSGYVITKFQPNNQGTDGIRFDITLEQARRVTYARGILIQNLDPVKSVDAKANDSSGTADAKEDENLFITDDILGNYAGSLVDDVNSVEIDNGN